MVGLVFGLQVFVKDGLSLSVRDDVYGGTQKPAFVPGELLIKFKEGTSDRDVSNLSHENGLSVIQDIPELGIKKMAVISGSEKTKSGILSSNPLVVYAEPNYIGSASTIPNDPSYSLYQWNLGKLNAPQAWDITTGSNNVIIAIVDTGVDYSHLDLNDPQKLLPGWDFVNNDNNAQDDNGHGTHVAGIAAASTNNSRGIAGTSWGARILPVKVANNNGLVTAANLASGIRYAVDNGAKVINMSLSFSVNSQTFVDQINYAYSHNVVMVGAAGNDGSSTYRYPASSDHVISVAATDSNDARASFSQFNDKVAVAAPGVGIYSTYLFNSYASIGGTSMAAPHVSGVAALLLSQNASRTPDQIKYMIGSNAEQKGTPGFNPQYGFGRVNAYYALTNHINYLMPWYDQQSAGMLDWAMVANPNTNTTTLNSSLTVGPDLPASLKGTYATNPGLSVTPSFSGTMGGPVKASSSDGSTQALFSQRTLFNGNFNETMGVPESKLETDYYFPWYDNTSPFNTFIMITNRGSQQANVQVFVHGNLKGTYQINPNAASSVTYSLTDGPVEVRSTNNQKLLVS